MKVIKKIKEQKNKVVEFSSNIDRRYLIIFIVALIIFVPYISDKIIQGDDYECHIANIYAIDKYISIQEWNFLPCKINPVMANDMGYGNGIFYPQLSYYMTEFIYLIIKHFGMTIIHSIKIFEFLVVLLSGIFMYKFVNKAFENKDAGLVSAIMYICTPYFISDIFHRMAYAEITIFLFMPIVMISIFYIFNKNYKKFLLYFVIGYLGMIHSHLVMTFYFTLLLAIILLINIKKVWNKKAILSFLLGTVIVLGISSPFLCTMFEHKLKGNYIVFKEGVMSSIPVLKRRQIDLYDILNRYSDKAVSVYTSLIVLIFCGITIYNRKKLFNNNKDRIRLIYSMCVFTIIAFILSSNFINWEKIPKILWFIQFPWRMCTFIALGTSIIAGMAITLFKEESKKIAFLIVCIICILDVNYVINKDKLVEIEEPNDEYVSSFDNRSLGWGKEYLPVNSLDNIEYLKNRKQEIIIKEGDAETQIIKNKTPYLQFVVKVENNTLTKVEIPRIFYYGYEIKIDDGSKELKNIDYYENDKGFIEFETNSSGIITVEYKGTILNKITNVVAILTMVLFIIYNFIVFKNEKTHKNERCLNNAKNGI